ncbi:hypothetical protein BV22DRAFT_8466 [Leucogyrophana mollusca]|uniref:Uncharacterized protein n=1 Tax=Leucogyrophana mollusca TaxID=85980 RepID=A0ACB8C133_9AGAM|nr:hypothetical protein BV22DRAFT_8466 [Leucogyrophana mollusca]
MRLAAHLLLLYSLAFSTAALANNVNDDGAPITGCRARSWVRAPDMVPGTVLEGDVKVRLDGDCPEVTSYTLGLRFKERIFVKTLRNGSVLPPRPEVVFDVAETPLGIFDLLPPSGSAWESRTRLNQTEWDAYESAVKNRDLWIVRDEEVIAFEIRTLLTDSSRSSPPRTFTNKFGLLVPNTNYPPAHDYRYAGLRTEENRGGEEYFTEILFANGTSSELTAGVTAFLPTSAPVHSGPTTINVTFVPETEGDALPSNYTAEVTFPSGTTLPQGSVRGLLLVVHRTQHIDNVEEPVSIAMEYDLINQVDGSWSEGEGGQARIGRHMNPLPLRTKSQHFVSLPAEYPPQCFEKPQDIPSRREGDYVVNSYRTGQCIPIRIRHEIFPDFTSYYQKSYSYLRLRLIVPKAPEKQATPPEPPVDDEEYEWVPWQKPPPLENILDVRDARLIGDINVTIIPQLHSSSGIAPIHHMSDDARSPIFVDPSTVDDLRALLPEERDRQAPLSRPQFKVFAQGDEAINRYYVAQALDHRLPIYVGETWENKVLPHMQHESQIPSSGGSDETLVVQGT